MQGRARRSSVPLVLCNIEAVITTDQRAADSTTLIELHFWGDLVCPWSWLGKRRLETAIAAFERPSDVTLTLHAFEIEPDAPVGAGTNVIDHLGRRFGGDAHAARLMLARVSEAASDDDIVLDFDHALAANTFDAHRLCALALQSGGHAQQSAAVERFHSAHFSEGMAIDDHEVLQRAAAECGLDERRVAAVLASDDYAKQVRADEDAARAMGITSVPAVVANDSAPVSGPRSVDDYLALVRRVATGAG